MNETTMITKALIGTESILNGLRTLYNEQKFCDVTLSFPGSHYPIKCHSVVLASISDAFFRLIEASRPDSWDEGIVFVFTDDIGDQMEALLDDIYQNFQEEDPVIMVHANLRPYLTITCPFLPIKVEINDNELDFKTEEPQLIKMSTERPKNNSRVRKRHSGTKVDSVVHTKKKKKFDINDDPKFEKLKIFEGKQLTEQLLQENEFQAYLSRTLSPIMISHRLHLFKELHAQYLHGLMALNERSGEPGVYDGTMIATAKDLRDPDASMAVLLRVMNQILGLPFTELLETPSLYTGTRQEYGMRRRRGAGYTDNSPIKKTNYPKTYADNSRIRVGDPRNEHLGMTEEQLKVRLSTLKEEQDILDECNKSKVQYADLRERVPSMMKIKMKEEVKLDQETGLVLLCGQTYQDLCMISVFSKEILQKVLKEPRTGNQNPFKLKLFMFDIFAESSGIKFPDLLKHLPNFERQFNQYRNIFLNMKHIKRLLEGNTEQCEHCGLAMKVASSREKQLLTKHIKKCKLEKSSCDCNVIFKTAAEKRRHAILYHSSKKVFTCPKCTTFIGKTETALEKHTAWFHGEDGVFVTCEICGKHLKSKYHLSVHRFTHREYKCEHCGEIITGNADYKRHIVEYHGKGFQCPRCPSVLRNEEYLIKHMKGKHAHEDL